MDLISDKRWGTSFWTYAGGTLPTVVNTMVLRCQNPGSQAYRSIEVSGGDTVRFSVMARRTSGDDDDTFVFLDSPTKAANKDIAYIISEEYVEHVVSWTAPLDVKNVSVVVGVGVGASATAGATAEYINPKIEVLSGSSFAPLRTLACGLLRNTGAGWEMHPDYASLNVASVAQDTVNKWVTVTLNVQYFETGSVGSSRKPLAFVSPTPDNINFVASAGSFGNWTTGLYFRVILTDPATKTRIDPSTLTSAYVFFEVKTI